MRPTDLFSPPEIAASSRPPLRAFAAFVAAFACAALCAFAVAAEKADLSVDEIVAKTNLVSYYQGADGRAQVHMTITDGQGRTREREFTILRWDEGEAGSEGERKDQDYAGNQRFYVYFHRPADVNRMVFLVWKNLDKDDDRWLYMPALDLVKRIASSDKRTSFVGSHFLYEDVSGRHIDEDTHELVEVTDNYYVLKNTPKDPASVEFAYFKMWIHKTTFLVVKTEYYDAQGEAYRTYAAEKVEEIDGYQTVTKSSMSDTKLGGKTVMEYSAVKYNIGIGDDIFTERYLRRPPFEHLK